MTNSEAPGVVRDYFTQLDAALAGIPPATRHDIIAGLREELDGLDDVTAASRILELGDPEFIAAEARAAIEPGDLPAPATANRREQNWQIVLIPLVVMFGGVIVPVIGTIVGLILLWTSSAWTRVEKWVATLAPFALLVVTMLAFSLPVFQSGGTSSTGEQVNPLVPVPFAGWTLIVVFPVAYVILGAWLMCRATRRARTARGSAL